MYLKNKQTKTKKNLEFQAYLKILGGLTQIFEWLGLVTPTNMIFNPDLHSHQPKSSPPEIFDFTDVHFTPFLVTEKEMETNFSLKLYYTFRQIFILI